MHSLAKIYLFFHQLIWTIVLIPLPAPVEGVSEVCPWTSSNLLRQTCPLHIDGAAETSNKKHLPWTHKPSCLPAEVLRRGMPKVCVYTSSKFNQKGISFITTPETAANVSEMVQSPIAVLQARSRFPNGKLPYRVTDLPGKGKGVVATRTIQPYEVIMEDFSSLVVDSVCMPANTPLPVGMDQLLNLATDQLGDRERVISLAVSGRDRNIVADIIGTNAFGVDLNGREHKGLFPEIARINHACDSNAAAHSTPRLSMKAVALRTIAPGEEITISYITMGLPSTMRAEALKRSWGFTCNCAMCAASAKERMASDMRRERLAQLNSILQDSQSTTNHQDLVRLMEESLGILKKERLPTTAVVFYVLFMNIYYQWGELDSSIKYGKLAYETMAAFDELDSALMREAKENLENLESERDQA